MRESLEASRTCYLMTYRVSIDCVEGVLSHSHSETQPRQKSVKNEASSTSEAREPDASLTAELVARSVAGAQKPLSDTVGELARQCVLDWVGVALAGSQDALARLLREQAEEDGGTPVASIVGSGGVRLSVRQAALVNGATGHALDYDDANVAAQGHVTAAVLPAVLAVGEANGASGEEVLRAFAAGYEMAGAVGQYLGRTHYELGFHGTATVGSFGAACAAALLMGLDAQSTAIALGIAGTQAGGMKAQFGTMCKPLHAGKAAENGVVGAQLAARGFTGCRDLLAAPQGFGAATSPEPDVRAALAPPPGGSYLNGNLFRYHAACYGTHATLEAVRALCVEHDLTAGMITRIDLDVESRARAMCNIARPESGLQAKFSLRLNAALAVLGEDTASPAIYSDAIVSRTDLVAVRDRVNVHFMPPDWPPMASMVRITTCDGRVLQKVHDSSVPDPDLARQRDRLTRKFMALAVPVVGSARAVEIERAIGALDRMVDIRSLMSLLRQPKETAL